MQHTCNALGREPLPGVRQQPRTAMVTLDELRLHDI